MKKHFVSKGASFLLATFLYTSLKAENTNISIDKNIEGNETFHENQYEKETLNGQINQPIDYEANETEYKNQDIWLFYINWGTSFTSTYKSNSKLETDFLSSRFINLSVFYDILNLSQNIFLYLGIGWSDIDYSFQQYKEKKNDNEKKELFTIKKTGEKLEICSAKDRIQKDNSERKVTYSSLTTNPINISIEAVLYTNKYYHNDGFVFSLGFSLYFLQSPYTTIRYKDKKEKVEEGFEYSSQTIHTDLLEKSVQYGIYTKIKWGRFGLGYEWVPSNLFKNGTGIEFKNSSKISISINLL